MQRKCSRKCATPRDRLQNAKKNAVFPVHMFGYIFSCKKYTLLFIFLHFLLHFSGDVFLTKFHISFVHFWFASKTDKYSTFPHKNVDLGQKKCGFGAKKKRPKVWISDKKNAEMYPNIYAKFTLKKCNGKCNACKQMQSEMQQKMRDSPCTLF